MGMLGWAAASEAASVVTGAVYLYIRFTFLFNKSLVVRIPMERPS